MYWKKKESSISTDFSIQPQWLWQWRQQQWYSRRQEVPTHHVGYLWTTLDYRKRSFNPYQDYRIQPCVPFPNTGTAATVRDQQSLSILNSATILITNDAKYFLCTTTSTAYNFLRAFRFGTLTTYETAGIRMEKRSGGEEHTVYEHQRIQQINTANEVDEMW